MWARSIGRRYQLAGCLVAAIMLIGCQDGGLSATAQAKALGKRWPELPVRQTASASASLALTLYPAQWGIVSDTRSIELADGEQLVRFPGVAGHSWERLAADQVRFRLTLPAKSESILTYQARILRELKPTR
ncbi:MAG: hypothetical protein HY692_02490 [Cyanobacteria bacterium NC_groundwater_1444_Ag_S-0.65um_54_12]|nr:hypothetical protein [Cyanobacteria bacterium NC_groundwater_1444_Ag_S-0.65um_54_12]